MTTVFRHYDQAALDREYDNRAKVADFPSYLERYRQSSEAVYRQREHQRDIAYGPHPAQRLDIFPPIQHGAQLAPVHVFIHGGYWKSLSKEDFAFSVMAAPGALNVLLEYPLIPTVDMAQLVAACRQGLAWVHRHASEFGADPQRIVVSGHSAGGHLAAMLLATEWPRVAADLPADLVKAILGISGLYDLLPIQRCFLNAELQLNDASVSEYSPVQLSPPTDSRVLLAVGDQEGEEYARQSQDLAHAWRALAEIQVIHSDDHHFSIVCQLETPDSLLSRYLQRLLRLKSP